MYLNIWNILTFIAPGSRANQQKQTLLQGCVVRGKEEESKSQYFLVFIGPAEYEELCLCTGLMALVQSTLTYFYT